MLKKTMALVLTLMMTAALAVPMVATAASSGVYTSSDVSSADKTVFSSGTSGKSTIIYNSQTDVPTLNLTITGGGGLVMNPYGIALNTATFGLGDVLNGSSSNKNQIISTQMKISSTTTVPVLVGATVRAELGGGATLATGKLTTKDTTKKVALWLVAWQSGNTADSDTQFKTFDRQTANVTGTTGTNAQAGVLFVKTPYVNSKGENANASMYTIPAYTNAAQTCHFQFFGDMVAEPLNNPWTTDDKVTPTLILDFQLQQLPSA